MKWRVIIIITVLSALVVSFVVVCDLNMRLLPKELYENTEHFVPKGYADKYWTDNGFLDGFHMLYYELSQEEISQIEAELNADYSIWKLFTGEHLKLFEKKYGLLVYSYDETKDISFRDGTFYYLNCDNSAREYSYFNILKDTYYNRPTWFFIYDADNGKYYAVYCY